MLLMVKAMSPWFWMLISATISAVSAVRVTERPSLWVKPWLTEFWYSLVAVSAVSWSVVAVNPLAIGPAEYSTFILAPKPSFP